MHVAHELELEENSLPLVPLVNWLWAGEGDVHVGELDGLCVGGGRGEGAGSLGAGAAAQIRAALHCSCDHVRFPVHP
jgi:hypothetical protein